MEPQGFWRESIALQGAITPRVIKEVLLVGLIAAAICQATLYFERSTGVSPRLEVGPYEIAGAVLGLLLVLRTNAGYDRWWEARKLWGGIVNQCRNLGAGAIAYGPADTKWRRDFIEWIVAFPFVSRFSLRGEKPDPHLKELIGAAAEAEVIRSAHMPTRVALELAKRLRDACDQGQLDRFAFLQLERERALLIDHIGGCERILRSPLPRVYSIMVRRFILLFVVTLPLALLHRMSSDWLVPFMTMLAAYPMLSLDQIGVELQNPFDATNVTHIPIETIAATIEENLFGLLGETKLERSP